MAKRYEGADCFRQRLIMSTLSGKSIRIDSIRPEEEHVGLSDYEISFMRLLEAVTNGSVIEINYTGTSIYYKPGAIVGGKIMHDCETSRSVGYFLEFMIVLAPFSKNPFELTLIGITNDNVDPSIDCIRNVSIPLIRRFGVDGKVEIKVFAIAAGNFILIIR